MSMSIPEMTALIARIPEPERSRIRDYIRSLENRLALAESALNGEREAAGCTTEQECEWQPWCRIHANCRRKVEQERTAKHVATGATA